MGEQIFEGKKCPICKKGTLRGHIKRKSKVLLRCDNCKTPFLLRKHKIGTSIEDPGIDFEDDIEPTIIPEGVFIGFLRRVVLYCIAFGTENINVGFQTHEKTKLPIVTLYWMPIPFEEKSIELQLQEGIKPIRVITFLALDPLWMKYSIANEPLTKLASNEELTTLLNIEGTKV